MQYWEINEIKSIFASIGQLDHLTAQPWLSSIKEAEAQLTAMGKLWSGLKVTRAFN